MMSCVLIFLSIGSETGGLTGLTGSLVVALVVARISRSVAAALSVSSVAAASRSCGESRVIIFNYLDVHVFLARLYPQRDPYGVCHDDLFTFFSSRPPIRYSTCLVKNVIWI